MDLPKYFETKVEVLSSTTFPVEGGTVLDVNFECGAEEMAVGDKTITCQAGTHFIYSKTPRCLTTGRKFHPPS